LDSSREWVSVSLLGVNVPVNSCKASVNSR